MTRRTFSFSVLGLLLCGALHGAAAEAAAGNSATNPVPRDPNWVKRHEGFVQRAKQGDVDVLFMGDSITDAWRRQKLWKEKYEPLKAVDFGISGDRTEHVLWRMANGECEGINPKLIVLMIGTNNTGKNSAPEIVEGITAIVRDFRKRLPSSKILLLGVFPRGEKAGTPIRQKIKELNGWFTKKDKTDLVEGDGFQQSALEYPGLSKEQIFEALEEFYHRYYFNKFGKLLIPRKPSWRIFKSMLEDRDVFVRRSREGLEFFKSLAQRREDLAAQRSAKAAAA